MGRSSGSIANVDVYSLVTLPSKFSMTVRLTALDLG